MTTLVNFVKKIILNQGYSLVPEAGSGNQDSPPPP